MEAVSDFNRIITLLRKEKGVTQKEVAAELGVSQALLSHYEKGIRECGLDFVVRLADYYNVSCDYLLGRSADRSGLTLSADELPDGANSKADTHYKGSVLPTLNKKIIFNSLNILFDKLNAHPDKILVGEISNYLMTAVYRMFRLLYGANPKNAESLFSFTKTTYPGFASASMAVSEAKAHAILSGEETGSERGHITPEDFSMTTESLTRQYPLYATSLFNLIKTSEDNMGAHSE
ncbi:helix-turn-helix transcriptional regulator [Ruminococcaceae bacterium OttesenSCG-928-N02]|nr:helix-turn-helix transcriptional regulator [Ruminococcaceae bacterium OttesenSCG-928-N02]